jgi:hypothetical protein
MLAPARGRIILAGAIVVVTVIATWMLIDYRTQPPAPPAVAAPL